MEYESIDEFWKMNRSTQLGFLYEDKLVSTTTNIFLFSVERELLEGFQALVSGKSAEETRDLKGVGCMDFISRLPDAVLLEILSLLPAKDVVATMVLSKRWQFLWMFVPRLTFDDSYQGIEHGRFSRFVDRYLLCHEVPILKALHFKLGQNSGVMDIGVWTKAAVKRSVCDLIIEMDCSSSSTPVILPRSLYACCTMLVTLKLDSVIFVDVSSLVSFTSLKTLSLFYVKYPNDDFVKRLLSNCLVLEVLAVERDLGDNVTIFTVLLPSVRNLFLCDALNNGYDDGRGFVIDAPSLEYLDIVDYMGGFCVIENDMPSLVKADIDVTYSHSGRILSSISSAKHLNLCLRSAKDGYPVASVFKRLVHLRICTCETEWLNLLLCLLRDSPILQSLKLEQCHDPCTHRPFWSEPSVVPECVISSLETLEWVKYEGTEEEKEFVAFILRSSKSLKKVTIFSKSTDPNKKLMMIQELSSSPRRSPTCQLIFF